MTMIASLVKNTSGCESQDTEHVSGRTFPSPERADHGQIAAPVFKVIAERAANYLNLKPDLETDPPGGVYFTAFVTRLVTICSMRVVSPSIHAGTPSSETL